MCHDFLYNEGMLQHTLAKVLGVTDVLVTQKCHAELAGYGDDAWACTNGAHRRNLSLKQKNEG